MDITIRHCVREGIPLLELFDSTCESMPMVVMQHGYTGLKEHNIQQAYFMATQGFFTVLPDAYLHGERAEGESKLWPNFLQCIVQTSMGMNGLLASYDNDVRVDTGRAGLMGYSMGGFVCFYYLTQPQRRFKALCPVIATPDWVSMVNTPEIKSKASYMGILTEEDEKAFLDQLTQFSPAQHLNIDPMPLLIQNGDKDQGIPVEPVQRYVESIRGRYSNHDELRFIVYPGLGHTDNQTINRECAEWFKTYLV